MRAATHRSQSFNNAMSEPLPTSEWAGKMRVVVVCDSASEDGGASQSALSSAADLARRGVTTIVLPVGQLVPRSWEYLVRRMLESETYSA